jgi:DNA polymerase-3 subunit alpha
MGIEIDPPDVNRSGKLFTIVDGRIVYGLLGIKGLGDATADEIVRGRNNASEGGGPYQNFMDFLTKIDIKLVGKAVIEKLIQTGAFDCMRRVHTEGMNPETNTLPKQPTQGLVDRLGTSRENLLGNLERAVEYVLNQKEDKKVGQSRLFGDTGEKEYVDFVFENFPETSRLEKLKIEKQLIGFYFSGHPMDDYRDLWQKAVKVDLGHPETAEPGGQILIGIIKAIRIANSKSGKMAYITIGDYNGEIDMIFFSRIWETCQSRIQEDQIAIVKGRIDYQKDREKYSFIAESLVDIREIETVIAEEEELRRKREKFRNTWLYMTDLKGGGLAQAERGSYTVLGQLSALRETKDRNDNDMAFGTLRDFEGDIDLVFFSKIWNECRDILTLNEFVALKGNIDPANDRNPQKPSFKVSSIADIAALSRSATRKAAAGEKPEVPPRPVVSTSTALPTVHARLNTETASRDEGIYLLQNYILGNPGPCKVFIHVPTDSGEKIIRLNAGVSLETTLENCTGVVKAWKE